MTPLSGNASGRGHVSNLMFHVAMIQFTLCPVSAGLRVNRPRKSGTNTRRSRSAKHLPLCAAITVVAIDITAAAITAATTAEGIFALGRKCFRPHRTKVNIDNVDPVLPVRFGRLRYQTLA